MELDILKTLIENRNKAIDKPFIKDPSYDYLNDTRNNISDIKKLLTSYIYITTNKPIEECTKIINDLNLDNIRFTEADFMFIANFLIRLKENNDLTNLKEFLKENRLIKSINLINGIGNNDDNEKVIASLIKTNLKKNKIDITGLITLLEDNYEIFLDICALIVEYKTKEKDLLLSRIKRYYYPAKYGDESTSYYKKEIKAGRININSAQTKVKKHVEDLDALEKSHYKSIELEKYHNELLLSNLEQQLQKEEVTNIKPLIKRIVDPKIKEIVLLIIYKHNLAYLKGINTEYEKLMSNSTTRYISLLHEYGISITEDEVDSIKHNEIDDVKEILSILSSINIQEISFLSILKITNLETTKEIKELTTKSYISQQVLNNNINIFNSNNNLLNVLKQNIQTINNYQLNPKMFSDIEEILFIDSNLLENNLRILESYNLIKSLKNSTNFNFLLNNNIDIIIDKYLELGYEKVLEEDIDLLNYQDTRRVEILSNMGYVLDKEELYQVLDTNKFFIKDEELDDYIPNIVDCFKEEEINISLDKLLEYKKTTRILEISGHIISINKVLRELEKNKSLKEAIYFNMNLDIDSYREIQDTINGKNYLKQ